MVTQLGFDCVENRVWHILVTKWTWYKDNVIHIYYVYIIILTMSTIYSSCFVKLLSVLIHFVIIIIIIIIIANCFHEFPALPQRTMCIV